MKATRHTEKGTKMKEVVFAGTLCEIDYEKGNPQTWRMRLLPDAEYVVSRKYGSDVKKCVVFQPMSKWQLGYVFRIEDELVIRGTNDTINCLMIGCHYEFHCDDSGTQPLIEFMVDDASSSLGKFSVTKIRAL